ncbi:MAG TPA: hypothetical protein VNO70_01560 [Blastocatellia bacterium]|nr:hypothetical protein [Blastocatellia bacterium]
MGRQQRQRKVTVLAIAVESKEADVRELARSFKVPVHVILGSESLVTSFGNLASVPTMYVFDREGKTAAVFYGAPKDLHEKVGRALDALLK